MRVNEHITVNIVFRCVSVAYHARRMPLFAAVAWAIKDQLKISCVDNHWPDYHEIWENMEIIELNWGVHVYCETCNVD